MVSAAATNELEDLGGLLFRFTGHVAGDSCKMRKQLSLASRLASQVRVAAAPGAGEGGGVVVDDGYFLFL